MRATVSKVTICHSSKPTDPDYVILEFLNSEITTRVTAAKSYELLAKAEKPSRLFSLEGVEMALTTVTTDCYGSGYWNVEDVVTADYREPAQYG